MERNFKAGDKVEWSTDDADFAGEVVATDDEIWVYVQTPTQPGKILMVPWFKVNPALSPVQTPTPTRYTEIMKATRVNTLEIVAITLWAAGAWACAFAVFALLVILAG